MNSIHLNHGQSLGAAAAWSYADGTLSLAVRLWNRSAPRSAAGFARRPRPVPTVRDFVVPAPVRLAQRLAAAAIVRDVAALGAVVLFATMLAVLLGGPDPSI